MIYDFMITLSHRYGINHKSEIINLNSLVFSLIVPIVIIPVIVLIIHLGTIVQVNPFCHQADDAIGQ